MVGVMQPGALLSAAAEFGVPIDQVVLEVRRVSDNSVALSRTLGPGDFTTNPDDLRITLNLQLNSRTEDFSFIATARSGGVDYYQATGTITAVAYQSTSSTPITPTYVGPGSNATGITLPDTLLGDGESATLVAVVDEDGTVVTGVPIAFASSDSTLLIPARAGLDAVTVTAPATGTGSVLITARTPTNVSGTSTVSWAPKASALVLVSGNGQTVNTGANAAAPLVVQVRDAQGNGVQGTVVTFAVASGPTGTTVAPTSVTSNAQGNAQTTLTAGNAAGAISVTATAAGLTGSPVTFAATAVTTVGVPTTVTATTPTTQNTVVNSAVSSIPSVIVRDAQGTAVPNVTVTFAVTAGGGSLTGGTQTTNSSGIATVGSWTVGTSTATANTLTATVQGLTPVTFTATPTAGPATALLKIQGDSQTANSGAALAVNPTVEVRDQFNNVVPGATVTWTPTDGTATPPSGPTGTSGQASTIWTLGQGQINPTLTARVGQLTPIVFSATTTFTSPTILLSNGGTPLVGVGLTNTINVTLSQPAGVNGAQLALSSDAPTTISVGTPTLNIPSGQSTGSFQVTGVSAGTTTIRATAPGYTAGAINLTATLQIISLPVTLNVPFGQNQNFPVSLAVAAPAGGVTISLVTSDATAVALVTQTVTIAAGSQVGTATAFGQFPGPATITATAPGFVGASTTAATTAALNIVQTGISLNASFGTTATVELRSGANAVPAPAGGLVVTLISRDPACLSVPATATIPAGLVNVTPPLTYGGTAQLTCTTRLVVTAPNITPDSVNVSVSAAPLISLTNAGQGTGRLGAGLQDNASGSLQVASPAATTVRLTSSDPAVLLLSPSASTAATPFIDIPIAQGGSFFSYITQGIAAGTATITASSPGYTNDVITVVVVTPGIDLVSVSTTTTTLGTTDVFNVRTGVPAAASNTLQAIQPVRFGGDTARITLLNSNPAVAHLSTQAVPSGDSVEVRILPLQSQTQSTLAAGGVALDPVGPGTTVISARAPGFNAMTTALGTTVTVNQPNLTFTNVAQFTSRIGIGLQDAGVVNLQSATPVATTLHLVSSDPTRLLLAPNNTTPGADAIDIPIAANGSSGTFWMQGLAASTGTVTITASIPGYNNGTVGVTVATPLVDLASLPTTTTSLAANINFSARTGVSNTAGTAIAALQPVRAGQPATVATLTSSNPAVGELITLADSASPVSVTIPVASVNSGSGVPAGGVAFDPRNAGTTTVSVTAPGFTPATNASVTVTISAPNIFLNTTAQGTARLGNGLMDNASGSLQAQPGAPDTVYITASDTTILKFSPSTTTPAVGLLAIPITATATSFSYVTHGFGTSATPDTIKVSATGFNPATTVINLVNPAISLSGLVATTTTFSTTDPFQAVVGAVNAAGTGFSNNQAVRFGSAPVTATFTNSQGTVAQLVTTPLTGNTVTAQIAVGAQTTPTSVALGGVAFDPLVAGTTTVGVTAPGFTALTAATQNVTVSAPNITLFTPAQGIGQVGSGLQDAGTGNFQVAAPSALTLRIQSSNPAVALIAPNATTAGAAFIDVPIVAGAGSFSYYIQAVEGQTGTVQISATMPGYNTGVVSATIVQPAIILSGLQTTFTTASPNEAFQAFIGVPSSNNSSLSAFQSVRIGGTPVTLTITNSNGTTGTLVTGPTTPVNSNSVNFTLLPGANTIPSTRASGGVEFDPLAVGTSTVQVTAPGFITATAATVNLTVNP